MLVKYLSVINRGIVLRLRGSRGCTATDAPTAIGTGSRHRRREIQKRGRTRAVSFNALEKYPILCDVQTVRPPSTRTKTCPTIADRRAVLCVCSTRGLTRWKSNKIILCRTFLNDTANLPIFIGFPFSPGLKRVKIH